MELSNRSEGQVQAKVADLNRSLAAASNGSSGIRDQLNEAQRELNAAESERRILEDRLDTAKQQNAEMRRNQEEFVEKIEKLQVIY